MTPTRAPARTSQTPAPTKSATPSRDASDDEILGITSNATKKERSPQQLAIDFDAEDAPFGSVGAQDAASGGAASEPSHGREPGARASRPLESQDARADAPDHLRALIDASPELRRAWDDANAYRETIGTPEEARAATALLADLDRMDALFFSRRPEDHAELARAVAELDPVAFASLAQAMAAQAVSVPSSVGAQHAAPGASSHNAGHEGNRAELRDSALRPARSTGPTPAQAEFFQSTNAAAVEGVVDVIESQVERLLPEGISKSARSRVVGEIYRDLDATLRSNRQLAQQMREAFRSGSLDAEHQHAIVSLVTGRARQALPGVAKRVLNEWTSTLVAANNDRRARQRSAERRVDIAGSSGSGSDGHRSMTPRDIDYARLSDTDILNM